MPQLDKVSWFAQIFWLLVCMFVLHFFFVRFFLPSLVSSLKLRSKIIQRLSENKKSMELENNIRKQYFSLLSFFNTQRMHFLSIIRKKTLVLTFKQYLYILNSGLIREMNQVFIEGYRRIRLFVRSEK